MNHNVVLTIIELALSITIEGIILSMIFQFISNKSQEKQQQHLQNEMANIEKQNKFDFEQIINAIKTSRDDVLNQIKEERKND